MITNRAVDALWRPCPLAIAHTGNSDGAIAKWPNVGQDPKRGLRVAGGGRAAQARAHNSDATQTTLPASLPGIAVVLGSGAARAGPTPVRDSAGTERQGAASESWRTGRLLVRPVPLTPCP